jgi:hypothetical protein
MSVFPYPPSKITRPLTENPRCFLAPRDKNAMIPSQDILPDPCHSNEQSHD